MKFRPLLQLLLKMSKATLHALLVNTLLLTALYADDLSAQTIKSIREVSIQLDLKNAGLVEVFQLIEAKTDYQFSYKAEDLDQKIKIYHHFDHASVADILLEVSRRTHLQFKQVNENIHVSKMPRKTALAVTIIEQISISGQVTTFDENEPLPGVNIIEKGTNNGTVTDVDGRYTLEVTEGAMLVFSSVGFLTEEIPVGNQRIIDLQMVADIEQLGEIVVIGYGTVNKSDLTGSVSSVKSDELNAFPTVDAVQALQGRAAGVQVQADNGGEPGADYNVLIRGSSSINASSAPLYVVDGFPQGALPPADDIESIEILKDASATAIYGSRGANGVVMITTKRGKPGKAKIDFNISYSLQKEINRYDLLNAEQFAEFINDVDISAGRTPTYPDPASLGEGTDWQEEVLQSGYTQNYNLSISGGNDAINYYVSGVYYDQQGIIINSDFKRYSLTSNLDIKASDRIKVGVNVFARRTNKNGIVTQEGTTGVEGSGVLSSALLFAPTVGIFNEDGSYAVNPVGAPFDNPVASALGRPTEMLADYFQSNIYGEFKITDYLQFKAILGANTNNQRQGDYFSMATVRGSGLGGLSSINTAKNTNLLTENFLTYSREFGNAHALTIMAGYSFQSFSSETVRASSSGFLTDASTWWNLGGGAVFQQPRSSLTESELSSYYGRVNYGWMDRYLFTVNVRYDGSSRFAANNKWAFFPSGAFAWNIHNESFLSGSETISQLKLRTSYGITGNQAISPYQSLARFRFVFSALNGNTVNAVSPLSVANDNLTWESTAQADVGLDVGLFNDRLVLTTDYYQMTTSDLLFSVPLPEYSGFSSQLKNIGKVENKGFEFAAQINDLVKTVDWDMGLNLSFNRNEVRELPDDNDILYRSAPGQFVGVQSTQILREGEPLGTFFGYVYEGVQQSGDELLDGAEGIGGERFKDLDGDGVLTNEDRTIIGDPNPDFHWGWNNDFHFKGFDLNIFFQGSQGNDMLNYTRMELEWGNGTQNSTTAMLDRWTPTHTDTDMPKAASRPQRLSTRWIEDGSYVRLKNVSLGYVFSNNLVSKLKMRSLRVYISGQNLLTFTKYKGFDPEVSYSSGNRNVGLDYGSYPNTKNFTFGVNVGF